MAAGIEAEFSDASVKQIESSGGVFEVTVDGDLVFSKIQLGRHAKEGEVLAIMKARSS